MKAILNLTLVCLAIMSVVLINSCRKDEFVIPKQDSLSLLEKSKAFFESNVRHLHGNKISSTTSAAKDIRRLVSREPLWNEATIKKLTIGSAVVVPLAYDTTLYTKTGKSNQALSINNISYLLMYPGVNGGMNAELVTWIPGDDWWDVGRKELKPFEGQILVENWGGEFIKGYQFKPDGSVQSLVKGNRMVKGAITSDAACDIIDWYTCWDGYGESGCRYDYSEVICAGGGSKGGDAGWTPGGGGSGDSGGGGGSPAPTDYSPDPRTIPCGDSGQSSTNTSKVPVGCDDYPEEVPKEPVELMPEELLNAEVFVDDKPAITDIQQYINCFTIGIGQSYKLIVYINQPLKGTNSQYLAIPEISPMFNGLGVKISGHNYDVGHVFVGFEQTNVDGAVIRQVVGFYPKSGAPLDKGTMKDNSGDEYDLSYSVNVNADQFQSALEKMKQDHNEADYVLGKPFGEEYNCADAAIDWLKQANIELPSASRGQFINTPGDFGQALSGVPGASTASGNAPVGTGPCN